MPEPPSIAERSAAVEGLPPPRARGPEFRRGVALGLFASAVGREDRSAIYDVLLDEIRDVGATDVELVVRWAQADVGAGEIAAAPSVSTDDAELREVIDRIHARGLRVFLMPIVHVEERADGKWRGTIAPSDWSVWWASYGRFILHYAGLAERSSVELFSVGSELISTESQEDRWRALIRDVRMRYRGRITYSANWDHFEPVRIWDAVDVMGVTAYQPLARAPSGSVDDAGWRPFEARLRAFGRPFLFTEAGYPSSGAGAARPWDHRAHGAADLALQTRCYRSLYEAWQASDRLEGVYLWNWFGRGGHDDPGYTPRGKPAAEIIRLWYGGRAR